MKPLRFCIVALLALASARALGDDATTRTKPSDADKSNRIICKEMMVTGTLLPGPRICHTKAEWDEIQRQAEEELREVQDNGSHP